MPVAKEKSAKLPKVKLKEPTKNDQNDILKQKEKAKLNDKKLIARADYRPEGWFAVVYDEGSQEAVFAELSANEQSAYEAAISEIQRINITAEGFASAAVADSE
ncbi:hypothetical protein EHS13_00710 [Paenibacillus psychroresistens]|uniref:Uncharacterized protein n=1 Tax=Paenibacillus psychroresistens TaxID=1778678 RepID=A0A6B8RBL8_9BACL|nr:hypothetical protein [Paenibacillus psychroresistens]QGQ93547.1 hypothetical protein EHS13_00710 [Paenibacillus psychroresistens]